MGGLLEKPLKEKSIESGGPLLRGCVGLCGCLLGEVLCGPSGIC